MTSVGAVAAQLRQVLTSIDDTSTTLLWAVEDINAAAAAMERASDGTAHVEARQAVAHLVRAGEHTRAALATLGRAADDVEDYLDVLGPGTTSTAYQFMPILKEAAGSKNVVLIEKQPPVTPLPCTTDVAIDSLPTPSTVEVLRGDTPIPGINTVPLTGQDVLGVAALGAAVIVHATAVHVVRFLRDARGPSQ